MKATINDVAKLAGVSIGTVSRAFNGYRDIRPDTKQRIEEAARALNYKPNVSARNLSAKNPPNIGLIVSGLLEANPRDSNTHLLLQGLFGYAMQNHLEIALYTTDSKEQRRNSFIEFCASHNLSGTILSGISMSDPYLDELARATIPLVSIDFPVDNPRAGWVSIDNRAAMRALALEMLALNHRDFLVIAGKENTAINLERLLGVRDAFSEAGIPLSGDRLAYADFSEELAYQEMKARLAAGTKPDYTCVLCFSDIMALGALRALKEAGVSVPGQVSLTGFDDLPIAAFASPPLTTVRQDMRQLGHAAAALLHRLMNGQETAPHQVLPHSLALRASHGPAPTV